MKTDKDAQGSENTSWVPQSLSETSVAIWGVGLMGGSLAMALHGKTASLYGIDTIRESATNHSDPAF
jgi:phosphoglycerate dehydrogenase-like enzyme